MKGLANAFAIHLWLLFMEFDESIVLVSCCSYIHPHLQCPVVCFRASSIFSNVCRSKP